MNVQTVDEADVRGRCCGLAGRGERRRRVALRVSRLLSAKTEVKRAPPKIERDETRSTREAVGARDRRSYIRVTISSTVAARSKGVVYRSQSVCRRERRKVGGGAGGETAQS